MFAWQWCLLSFMAVVHTALGVKANYERVEQLDNKEYMNFDLRIRKFNRTAVTLNGTVYINRPIDQSFVCSSNAFLSRLGNQQFAHSPLHLPTANMCEFMDHINEEYSAVIADVVNFPKKSECPITERTMYVKDKLFPTEVLPRPLSVGLWKMEFTAKLENVEVIKLSASIRLSDDYSGF
ncbi:uncharacterized protein LOC128715273 [Anopheles marshallii]|uniref:uncharacterized protein LOC128715273 n=1 Tax=Anopheles marshallii TaxID=1521116 RepID=UPI00237C32BB|nr:uncharacterized protein LOC128715273 [Anopheles marshallii]